MGLFNRDEAQVLSENLIDGFSLAIAAIVEGMKPGKYTVGPIEFKFKVRDGVVWMYIQHITGEELIIQSWMDTREYIRKALLVINYPELYSWDEDGN